MNKAEWFRAVLFKGQSDGGWGKKITKGNEEPWTTIYDSFSKTCIRRRAGPFPGCSPSCPSVLQLVIQQGPPKSSGHIVSLICTQSSSSLKSTFPALVIFGYITTPPSCFLFSLHSLTTTRCGWHHFSCSFLLPYFFFREMPFPTLSPK